MKLQTLLDRIYAAGHWFELDEHGRTVICRYGTTKPPTAAQQRAIEQHGAAIGQRMHRAAHEAAFAVERARQRRVTP